MTVASTATQSGMFTGGEEDFRRAVRTFLDHELDAKIARYVSGDLPIRHRWDRAAQAGTLGHRLPPSLGGLGASEMYGVAMSYEMGRSAGYATVGSVFMSDSASVFVQHATERAQQELAPRFSAVRS